MRGMAPPEEYAWYLLCSSEDKQVRRIPEAANWFELSIMTCHGQRLGTKKQCILLFCVSGIRPHAAEKVSSAFRVRGRSFGGCIPLPPQPGI